jgi:hypothetical protein
MSLLNCPVCEHKIEVADTARERKRVTCQNCFAQLAVFKLKGEKILGCALCKDPVFDPFLCGECERRQEKRSLLEEGHL